MSKIVWSEGSIARAIALQTLARKCVVLVNNCNWTGYECDVLGVTTDLRIIDIEVKISRADLKADVKKDKWWHSGGSWRPWAGETRPEPTPRTLPRKVWKHYYALPKEIWRDDLFDCLPSKASGVLLLDDQGWPRYAGQEMRVDCIRRATPAKDAYKLKPEEVMDIARLANLRMWEAYHRREQSAAEASRWYEQVRALTGGLAA